MFIAFGSPDGAVRGVFAADDDYLPLQDAAATPGAGGAVRGSSLTLRGVKAGRYWQAVVGGDTVAAVEATTAADAKDTLRLDGRKLVYAHDGAAATVSLSLKTRSGLFASELVRVAAGATVTAQPRGDGVRLSVRDKAGKVHTRELRRAAAELAVTGLSVRGGKARATVRVRGLKGSAGGAVVLRATRGGKTIARKLFTIAKLANGSRTTPGGSPRVTCASRPTPRSPPAASPCVAPAPSSPEPIRRTPPMSLSMRRALPLALLAVAFAPAGAQAAITKSSVTTPADPAFRLYEPEIEKAAEISLRVAGTTDGRAGELIDLLCTRGSSTDVVRENVPLGKDGAFDVLVRLDSFSPAACVLRAVPNKERPKDPGTFAGPTVSVAAFDPRAETVAVLESEGVVVSDYVLQSGQRLGAVAMGSAASGVSLAGVRPDTLDRYASTTWSAGAALVGKVFEGGRPSVIVDGQPAYVAKNVPLITEDGRSTAPKGFDGLRVAATIDERTGVIVVRENERVLRCDRLACVSTGVALERTVTLRDAHARADVEDRWVSIDGAAHQVQLGYLEYTGAGEASCWRFKGEPSLRAYEAGARVLPNGPGNVITHDGTPKQQPGTLSYDPAPREFAFVGRNAAIDAVELAVPAGGAAPVRRSFALGEVTVQADPDIEPPVVTIEGSKRTEAASVEVYGRALDNVGVVRLTVNGQDIAIGADGTYSTQIALAPGDNRITATATDAAGNVNTVAMVTKREVPQDDPESAETCTVPTVKAGSTVKAARAKLKKAGCRVSKTTKAVTSKKVRKGRVVGLSEKRGARIDKRTVVVRIKVSRGARRH